MKKKDGQFDRTKVTGVTISAELCNVGDGTLAFYGSWNGFAVRIKAMESSFEDDSLISGSHVLLPPKPHPALQKTTALFEDMHRFTDRFVSWTPEFRVGAVAYAMATWIYTRFQFFGCLQLTGPPGSGKTRSLEVLGQFCYHATRMSNATAPILFRVAEQYHPTLLIDEIDADLGVDICNVLREGTSHDGKVFRNERDPHVFRPKAHSCFCPKIYAGQEPLTDSALMTRIISENMGLVPRRRDLPLVLPDDFQSEGESLRARLVRWGLDNQNNIEQVIPEGMNPRQQQLFLPLFTVTPEEYWPELRALAKRQIGQTRRAMEETEDGEVVTALRALKSPEKVRPGEVAKQVNLIRGVDPMATRHPEYMTATKAGRCLKRLGLIPQGRDRTSVIYAGNPDLLQRLYETYLPAEGDDAGM